MPSKLLTTILFAASPAGYRPVAAQAPDKPGQQAENEPAPPAKTMKPAPSVHELLETEPPQAGKPRAQAEPGKDDSYPTTPSGEFAIDP